MSTSSSHPRASPLVLRPDEADDERYKDVLKFDQKKYVGKNYDRFLACRLRYQNIIGSRCSKKSYSATYKILFNMMRFKTLNVLVVRKVYATLKDSCFALLKKCVYNFPPKVRDLFKFSESPLEITYIPNSTKILFRGLDDPLKLSSIQVEHGVLAWAWIEELYQLNTLKEYQLIDQCIRGRIEEPGLYKCIIGTMNPWLKSHFVRTEFFEHEDGTPLNRPDTLAMVTTYKQNEFIDAADIAFFEDMRIRNPQLYEVAGLGHWGNPEGLVFNNWCVEEFDKDEISGIDDIQAAYGLDFGWEDPMAFSASYVSISKMTIWVYDEIYQKHLRTEDLAELIKQKGYGEKVIVCDCAQPGDIVRLNDLDIYGAIPCRKYPGSIMTEIRFLQSFHIVIHPNCVGMIEEFSSLRWKVDTHGVSQNVPDPICEDHLVDSLRYATSSLNGGEGCFAGEAGGEQTGSTPPTQRKDEEDRGQCLVFDLSLDGEDEWP